MSFKCSLGTERTAADLKAALPCATFPADFDWAKAFDLLQRWYADWQDVFGSVKPKAGRIDWSKFVDLAKTLLPLLITLFGQPAPAPTP